MRQRWYDSGLGRFISRDPIGMNGGVNLYAYADNNPVKNIDPSGKAWNNGPKCKVLLEELEGLRASIDRQLNNLKDNLKKPKPLKYRDQSCPNKYQFRADIEGHLIKLAMDFSIYQAKYTRYILECNNFGPPPVQLRQPFPRPVPVPIPGDRTAPVRPWVPEPPTLPEWEPLLSDAEIAAALAALGTATYWIVSEGSRFVFPIRNLAPIP